MPVEIRDARLQKSVTGFKNAVEIKTCFIALFRFIVRTRVLHQQRVAATRPTGHCSAAATMTTKAPCLEASHLFHHVQDHPRVLNWRRRSCCVSIRREPVVVMERRPRPFRLVWLVAAALFWTPTEAVSNRFVMPARNNLRHLQLFDATGLQQKENEKASASNQTDVLSILANPLLPVVLTPVNTTTEREEDHGEPPQEGNETPLVPKTPSGDERPHASGGEETGATTRTNASTMAEKTVAEEKAEERRVVRSISGYGVVMALLGMIFTAYQMSENPDGIYAAMCRLLITVCGLALRILYSPVRYCCGGSSSNASLPRPSYASHMPVATMDYGYRDPGLELS
jgi:hypothetical protein